MPKSAELVLAEWADDLPAGKCRIYLHQTIRDHLNQDSPGPHPVGWVRQLPDGRVQVRLIDATRAGRDARALLEEGMVDVRVDGDVVRLE